MKAAVFHGPKQPLTIENVDIDQPLEREVLFEPSRAEYVTAIFILLTACIRFQPRCAWP